MFVKLSLRQLRKEVDELKGRKPELLEFRVGQHEEQLKTLRHDLDEFRTDMSEVKTKLDLIYDHIRQSPAK